MLRNFQHIPSSKPRRAIGLQLGKDMGESCGFFMGTADLQLYCLAKIWQLIPAMEGSSWLPGQIQ